MSTVPIVYKSVSGLGSAASCFLLLLLPRLHPKEGIRMGQLLSLVWSLADQWLLWIGIFL